MARRRERRHAHEAHGNHERWLITYADMITLLMVLFIVMFAISQVDQKRFMQLKEGMAAGFGQDAPPFEGGRSVLAEDGARPLPPIAPRIDQAVAELIEESPDAAERAEQRPTRSEQLSDLEAQARAELARFEQLLRRITRALRARGLLNDVAMAIDERGLRVSLVSRHIVFRPNRADLTPRGEQVLTVLAPVLRGLPNQIEIAGHTNQVKVKPAFYPSDWELSAARAVTALRYLHEQRGVPARNLSAVAYGHEQPLVDPARPGSQRLNKRVDVIVLSQAGDEVRRLFAAMAEAAGHSAAPGPKEGSR